MVTYINEKGEWVLYETSVTLRGGKQAIVQAFFYKDVQGERVKNWRVANKVREGFEIYENERTKMPFVRKKQ